jgi:sn-glycerol 3-phosphate transport system substrate-binding protein
MDPHRLLCLLALLLVLPACDRDSNQSAETGDSGTITATFWYSYGGRNREVLEELIERFHASQDRYRIEGAFQGSYFEALAQLRAALRTGEIPSFTHVVGEVLPYLWEAGVLAELTPFAEGDNPLDMEQLIPALTQDGYFDYGGREIPLFALPFNRSTPICYYNRDLFDEAGLSPPTTWDELRNVAAALTIRGEDGPSRWGFEVPIDWWFWIALLYQADGSLMTPSFDAPLFAEAGGRDALQFLVDLVRTDRVLRPPPGRDYSAWEVTNRDFIAGNVAMIWTSTAFLNYLTENAPFRLGTAPLPGRSRHGVPTGGTFFVIMKDAEPSEQEAAWAFINWMMQPEQTAYWAAETGYMPVHQGALELPSMQALYERDPNYRVALDQLEHAVPFPFSRYLFEIQREHIQPTLERPVLGLESVEEALGRASQEAAAALSP